jgi:hypothetical protein
MIFWQQTDNLGITAKCEYKDNIYTVTVSKSEVIKQDSFGQTFAPIFGMDIQDEQRSYEIAEKLAQEVEKLT